MSILKPSLYIYIYIVYIYINIININMIKISIVLYNTISMFEKIYLGLSGYTIAITQWGWFPESQPDMVKENGELLTIYPEMLKEPYKKASKTSRHLAFLNLL